MQEKMKQIYHKYKEIIKYIIFGGFTTIINIITYLILTKIIKLDLLISNVLAWFISVLFAYITNRIFVFNSQNKKVKSILIEISTFYVARIASLVCCDILLFNIMIKVLHINDITTKLILQIIVILMNYILSKFIIFKKDN